MIGEQFLRCLLDLLEQTAMIARLIDGGLKLLAKLQQAIEPLLLRQRLMCAALDRGHKVTSYPEAGSADTSPKVEQRVYRSHQIFLYTGLTTMKHIFLTVLLASVTCVVFAADPVSRREAARLQAKIDRIARNTANRPAAPARTAITEVEVNSYLRYELADRIPAGVTEPWVTLLDEGRVAGTAKVDLSRVAQGRKSQGMLDPFNYLTGAVPVAVNGVFKSSNGTGSFSLESASISGVPVPSWMLQEILGYYSKSSMAPNGVSIGAIEQPFELPSGIREIQLTRGQAIVIQ